ncbi:MAG: efflux RND transporter periplasmic adaptor subunit, partial [Thermoguttaceae bacterium]
QKVPVPFSDACELARQAALGLQVAHEHGMVHRDVKPSNLMLTREGQVKLLDLGLARFQGGLSQHSSVGMAVQLPSQPSDAADDMTGTGQAMGTADYMAPEQTSDSRTVDIRADVYSLGATLYKLLSGRAPFSGPEYQSTFDKMLAHRQTPPPPIQQFCPSIPEGLAAVLDRMLAKDPAARYQTPNEVAEALVPFCAGSDLPSLLRQAEASNMSPLPPGEGQGEGRAFPGLLPKPRRWRTIVAAAVALLLVGGLGYWLGITIHIRNPNGEEATLKVPNGSDVAVDNRGEATVTLPGATQVPPPKLFPVHVAPRGEAEPTVYAAGTLEPEEIVDVGSALAGQIVSLGRDSAGKPIDYMSPVEPGTLLAQIDPTVYKARVDQEEAGVRRAQAEVALANAKVKGETAEVANASIQAATATLRQCESALALAKTNLAYTTIKSPVKGVIIDRRVNIGQNVVPTSVSSLFLIAKDLKKMQIWAQVNEADVPRIRKGMAATFTVDAFPNETFHGTVSQVRLNAALMKNVVTYTVVVDFDNPDLRLMPYMTADVQFDVEPRKRAVVAPAVAPVTSAADAKAIQGTWEIVSSTFKLIEPLDRGENVTPDQVRQTTKIIIAADSFKVMGEHVVNQDFAYQLKLDATPKMIDLASGGRASLGIFQLTGNELKICASPLGSGGAPLRPSEFWAELGSGKELLVLRRVGDAVVSDDEKAILGTWRVETPLVHALAVPYPDSQLFADQKQEVVISAHTMKFLPSAESDGSHGGMRVGRGGHAGSEEAYALDPNSRPKIIDLTCYWRMPILATYELQGDRLTVCCEPGSWQRSARPTKLTADEKTHTALVVLKRVSKPAEKPKGAASQPAVVAPGSVPEVSVCRPVLRDVTDYKDFTGHTEASQTVDVRARVSGDLVKVLFKAGANVKQGDLLFEIDPRQHQAELDKRMADLSAARTRAQHATAELERAKPLAKSHAISTSDMHRVESEQKETQAAVLAAEADLKLAKLNLDDTKVRAAISGVISRPPATVGNFVTAGTQTLATIVCSDPLYVVFDVDERSVLDLRRQAAEEKAKTGRELPIEVRCGMANEKDCPRRAAIESKDARMDPATGTARWRATLPNPDGVLMPGMFARVRLLVGSPHKALLIPEQALGSDQGRRFVFVIDKRNTVERRFVETGQLAGELRVVTAGLTADDWVVDSGLSKITPGTIVKPKPESPPSVHPPPGGTAPDKGAKQEQPAATTPTFRTVTVTRGDIAATVYASGTIEPDEMVDVAPAVAGQIISLGPDPRGATDPQFKGKSIDYNSPVEPGTILAGIDPTVYKARVDQEEAGLRRARAELTLAVAKAKGQTPEVAQASLEAAKATLQQSQSALALAKTNLDYTVIRSPVKGVIIDRRVNLGQNVGVSAPNTSCLFLIAKDLKKM